VYSNRSDGRLSFGSAAVALCRFCWRGCRFEVWSVCAHLFTLDGLFFYKFGGVSIVGSFTVASSCGFEFPPSAQLERLTKEQRDSYATNGYFVVKGLVPPEDLQRYHDRFVAIAEGKVEPVCA